MALLQTKKFHKENHFQKCNLPGIKNKLLKIGISVFPSGNLTPIDKLSPPVPSFMNDSIK